MEHAAWCRRRLFVGFVTLKGICLLGPTENAVFHKVASWEHFAWVLFFLPPGKMGLLHTLTQFGGDTPLVREGDRGWHFELSMWAHLFR